MSCWPFYCFREEPVKFRKQLVQIVGRAGCDMRECVCVCVYVRVLFFRSVVWGCEYLRACASLCYKACKYQINSILTEIIRVFNLPHFTHIGSSGREKLVILSIATLFQQCPVDFISPHVASNNWDKQGKWNDHKLRADVYNLLMKSTNHVDTLVAHVMKHSNKLQSNGRHGKMLLTWWKGFRPTGAI